MWKESFFAFDMIKIEEYIFYISDTFFGWPGEVNLEWINLRDDVWLVEASLRDNSGWMK